MSVEVAKGDRPLAVGDRVWVQFYRGDWYHERILGFVGRRVLVSNSPWGRAKEVRRRDVVRREE